MECISNLENTMQYSSSINYKVYKKNKQQHEI